MQLPKAPTSGAFMSFQNEGDTTGRGRIEDINGNGTTFGGEPCPQVVLFVYETGSLVTVTCSQAQLWSKTVAAVEAGELAIGRDACFTMPKIEKRNGGKTLKHFNIETWDADPALVAAGKRHEDF